MDFQPSKNLIRDYYREIGTVTAGSIEKVLRKYTHPTFQWYGVHPFNYLENSEAVSEIFWKPFFSAWQSVQRREDIFLAGISTTDNRYWVTSMGHFMGLLDSSWLGIPATKKIAFLRYADFNCIENGKISKSYFFCDILGVFNQVGINPLPPQTGAEFIIPGPRTHDGLLFDAQDWKETQRTLNLINRMRDDLLNADNFNCPPELLAETWHKDMLWFGPTGIGSTYTINRYRKQHQSPFAQGLTGGVDHGHICRFAEGKYAAWFGWPTLSLQSKGGFLGLPASESKAGMRIVDIYRREGNKLAENWNFIDIPYWLYQQGYDVFDRTRKILYG